MKYILMTYVNQASYEAGNAEWAATQQPPADVQAAGEFFAKLQAELTESGEFVTQECLADPAHSKTVRKEGTGPVVSDGPFAEAKEVLVSYAIVDCASYDRALEIAAQLVDAIGEPIEVRPIMDLSAFAEQ